jgi:hypothetical protein
MKLTEWTDPDIEPEWLNAEITVQPSHRLHRLVAMLRDMPEADLTDEHILDLEQHVAEFRWVTSSGRRIGPRPKNITNGGDNDASREKSY